METGDKSSVEEIRRRFDADVERFSNLETGQAATVDAPLSLDLVTSAAAAINPAASSLLDIGCGAGNYSVKMLSKLPRLGVTLVDLSRPMLDRAVQRVAAAGASSVEAVQGDIREIKLGEARFDIVLAAATLHHLRSDAEWAAVFSAVRAALRPGGSFWIVDLVEHDDPRVQELMWKRYGEYLVSMNGEEYRDKVFAYVGREDSPRSMLFQIDALRAAGFGRVEVLHKNGCFAAFGAIA